VEEEVVVVVVPVVEVAAATVVELRKFMFKTKCQDTLHILQISFHLVNTLRRVYA